MNEEKTERKPQRLMTIVYLAVVFIFGFSKWYDGEPITFEWEITAMLGLISCLLWDIFDAVMYGKKIVIERLTVNVVSEEENGK